MNKEEFYSEYKRLHAKWPDKYMTDNPGKLRALFEMCQEFDVKFIRSFVDRALRANDANLDLMKAIIGEKRARRELAKTQELISKNQEISENFLESYLSENQAVSIWDLVSKRK